MDSWAGIRGTKNGVISQLPDSMAEYCHVEIYGDCNDADWGMLYTANGVAGTIRDRGTFSGMVSFTATPPGIMEDSASGSVLSWKPGNAGRSH